MKYIGIDLVDTARLNMLLSRYESDTLGYLFSPAEQTFCRASGNQCSLAISFSGKESIGKALGTGLAGLNWYDIQVLPKQDHTLDILLQGDALKRAKNRFIKRWDGYWRLLSDTLCITVVTGLN